MCRYGIVAAVLAAALLTGCSSDTPSKVSISAVEESKTVVTTAAAAEESGEGNLDEAVMASLESMEARLEEMDDISKALESAEAALASVEESVQEAVSSLAGESAEGAGAGVNENTYVSYRTLTESPLDHMNAQVTYLGRVVQAAALADGNMQLLLAVDNDDASRLVGVFPRSVFSGTLGHGDIVEVTGIFRGVNRYQMGSGEVVELPYFQISRLTVQSVAQQIPATTEAPATVPETAVSETEAANRQAGPGEVSAGPGGVSGGPGETAGGPGETGGGQAAGPGTS